MKMQKIFVLAAGFLLFFMPAPSLGGEGIWGPDGVIVCNGSKPAAGADGDGGSIIVYESSGSIYAQKLDCNGNTTWPESGVMVSSGGSDLDIGVDGDGSSIIVYENSGDIYAQKLDSNGNTTWPEGGVMVSSGGTDPAIGVDGDGSSIIVYKNGGIYAQKLDSNGNTAWPEGGVMVNSGGSDPVIGADREGSSIIVYKNGSIYAQKLDCNGNTTWPEGGVEVNSGEDPDIALDNQGSAVIVWRKDTPRPPLDVYHSLWAQKLDSDGNTIWPGGREVRVSKLNAKFCPAIGADENDSAIIVWQDDKIYMQKLDSNGNRDPQFPGNGIKMCEICENPQPPEIGVCGDGGAIIVWEKENRIHAQKFIRLRPQILGLSPANGAWGGVTRDICVSGVYFQDIYGEVDYVKLTPTAGSNDEIPGQNLDKLTPTSFTCDFDLSGLSVSAVGSTYYVVVYDTAGQTGTSDTELFTISSPEMKSLKWISAPANNINTGTQNNFVGQINCTAGGCDFLQTFTAENAGTAQANEDITALNLWQGPEGLPFDPATAGLLGSFGSAGVKAWSIDFGQPGAKIKNEDALYLTADISGGAQTGRTCRFLLPAQGAKFKYAGDLPGTGLASSTERMITKSASFYLDFISLAPVNAAKSQKNVTLGQIRIINNTGMSLAVTSMLICLKDKAMTEHGLHTVFDRIWIEQNANRLAELNAPFSTCAFAFNPPLSLQGLGEAVLKMKGNIKDNPEMKVFFAGLGHGLCINDGKILSEPIAGKTFPLLSSQVNIRSRELEDSFSNYPNPFQPGQNPTRISFYLRSQARVKLQVMSIFGKLVRQILDEQKSADMHEASWDGRNARGYCVKSGTYILCLDVRYADGTRKRLTRKVAVLK